MKNKTVLITGASRGIGLALIRQFLDNGYHVIGTSRSGKIENMAQGKFEAMPLDLSSAASIGDFEKNIATKEIKIDILINNAGIGPDLDHDLPDESSFRATLEVNLTGTTLFTESMLKHMNASGKLINISSKMGSLANCRSSDSPAYRISKAALNMYTKILANRLAGQLTVAAIHPGWVRTTIAPSNIHGRLSADESAKGIYNFVVSGFGTGTFWDVEAQRICEW